MPVDTSASRRLKGKIRREVIEGSAENDSNIFDNENDWSGGGANVSFEDGAMILERPGGQGKGGNNTNTKTDGTNIIICAVRPLPSGRGYKALSGVFSFRKIAPETISTSAVLHTAE